MTAWGTHHTGHTLWRAIHTNQPGQKGRERRQSTRHQSLRYTGARLPVPLEKLSYILEEILRKEDVLRKGRRVIRHFPPHHVGHTFLRLQITLEMRSIYHVMNSVGGCLNIPP